MTQLTKNFTLEELCDGATARRLGNVPDDFALDNMAHILAPGLQRVRDEIFGARPLVVHSGFRSVAVNHAVGGAEPPHKGWSYHIYGLAADFDPPIGMTHDECQQAIGKLKDFDFDLCMEESTADGAHRWIHLQFPKPGEKGRRLLRDAVVSKLGGTITRTTPG